MNVFGGSSATMKSKMRRGTSLGASSGTAWEVPGTIAKRPAGSASYSDAGVAEFDEIVVTDQDQLGVEIVARSCRRAPRR